MFNESLTSPPVLEGRRAGPSPILGNLRNRVDFRVAIRHSWRDQGGTRNVLPVPAATRHGATERLPADLLCAYALRWTFTPKVLGF